VKTLLEKKSIATFSSNDQSDPNTSNNLLVILSLKLIRLYQLFISPLLGPRCRFYPSCSSYMQQAIVSHGFFRGVYLGSKRLAKCHPFHPGGIDEVPSPYTSQHSHQNCKKNPKTCCQQQSPKTKTIENYDHNNL